MTELSPPIPAVDASALCDSDPAFFQAVHRQSLLRIVSIIGVESGIGAGNPGCAAGPGFLRSTRCLDTLDGLANRTTWTSPIRLRAGDGSKLGAVAELNFRLAERVRDTVRKGEFPLVIGGDHSIAIGTWSGVRSAMADDHRLGLLWIDAHLDSHTFATTPSQNIHGMPLACLLGAGEPTLTSIAGAAPKVQPADLCIVGARSFESAELRFLQRLGVRIFFMPEIRKRGLADVIAEAIGRVSRTTHGYGISFDVDALDPTRSSGTALPVPGGLFQDEVVAALVAWRQDPRCVGLEIVEYNPHLDVRMATAKSVRAICSALLG